MKVRELIQLIARGSLSLESEVRVRTQPLAQETIIVRNAQALNLRQFEDPSPQDVFLVLDVNLADREFDDLAARPGDKPWDGIPVIGTPIGRRQIVLQGLVAREQFRMGKLVGWHDMPYRTQPILEYPDGTREVLQSLAETNWK